MWAALTSTPSSSPWPAAEVGDEAEDCGAVHGDVLLGYRFFIWFWIDRVSYP